LSYWRGYSRPTSHHVHGTTEEIRRSISINSDAFENEPNDKELGVQLHNVSKVNNKQKQTFNLGIFLVCRLIHSFLKVVHLLMLYVILV
jgi:hypothetical protein